MSDESQQDAAKNQEIGERIFLEMWRQKRTHDDLADVIGLPRASVSRRLRGKIKWGAIEVQKAAEWLRVPVADLLPPSSIGSTEQRKVVIPVDEQILHFGDGTKVTVSRDAKDSRR